MNGFYNDKGISNAELPKTVWSYFKPLKMEAFISVIKECNMVCRKSVVVICTRYEKIDDFFSQNK